MFKKLLYPIILVLLIISGLMLLIFSNLSVTTPMDTKVILINDGKFEPGNLTIKKNTKVSFKNEDEVDHWPASDLHPTHGIYPEFDPQQAVKPGGSWEFIFDKIGKWKFHDHLIPLIRSQIIVTD